MLYAILKIIFKIALRIFFRRIEVQNRHLIPATGPLLIASNHPNTFMDPIAVAAIFKQDVYFITKSTVFNSPFKKWLLQKANMIPVYRREDGVVPATGNDATFRKCTEYLLKKRTLIIFPEGNSFNERRLRPLKTGAARMAMVAESQANAGMEVKIIPIGVNYTDPTRFRSDLFINVGELISIKDYTATAAQDSFKAAQDLTAELRRRLTDLIIVTETEEEDELVQQIELVYRADLIKDLGLEDRQEDKFVLTKSIAESIRYFQQQEPGRVEAIRKRMNRYFQNLNKLGLQDKYLAHSQANSNLFKNSFRTILYLLAGFPVFIWGILTNYLPYYIPGKIADALTSEEEFRAPVMMTAGILSFGLVYVLEIAVIYAVTNSVLVTLVFLLSLPLSGFFALYYSNRLRNTQAYLKLFAFLYKNKPAINELLQQRREILIRLDKARRIYLQRTSPTQDEAPVGHQ
ncbi:MAG: glycerol acyltransferase [Cytophagales bacterium CG18_big_fil_WC_8_21_14_2_50_42_9]|nr:MAG: glycerol acyltransferase [Cytophagales bacterium CG18_big_fil_WC_8_21_14_2_50_42_9]